MKNIIVEQFGRNLMFGSVAAVRVFRMLPNMVKYWIVSSLALFRTLGSPKRRFLIYAQGRTGSTLLVDLINSHPDMFSFGEIFAKQVIQNVADPVRFATGLSMLCRKSVCGFKVKIYQLTMDQCKDPAVVLNEFANSGWKIIHLHRDNIFFHALSDLRSEQTKVWHEKKSEAGNSRPEKLHIDFDELVEAMEYRERQRVEEAKSLSGIDHFSVSYEDDLQDSSKRDVFCTRILNYLEVDDAKLETRLRKVSRGSLRDLIENYDDLIGRVRATRFAEYLES